MIRFTCRCGHAFALADDEAGGLIQCPECGLLNDVPGVGELDSLNPDGTVKVGDPLYQEQAGDRLGHLAYIYKKARVDERGEEIDLRNPEDDLDLAPSEEYDLRPDEPSRADAPKYDPVTGELIRPIDLTPDGRETIRPQDVPIARPAIHYASGSGFRDVSPAGVFLELFRPVNLLALGFVLLAHLLFNITIMVVLFGLIFVVVAPLIMSFIIVGHYGNVIDDIGPGGRDELPRVMREMSWHDDLWGPFSQVAGAFFISFLPALIVQSALPLPLAARNVAGVMVALAGVVVFPAVLLTLTTSGTWHNLRPDRVAGVMRRCGVFYPVLVVEAAICMAIYPMAVLSSLASTMRGVGMKLGDVGLLGNPLIGYGLLVVAIVLIHLFCWHVGLMYRAHQPEFPWILQHHIRTKKPGHRRTRKEAEAIEPKRRPSGVAGVPARHGDSLRAEPFRPARLK
jgi:hypothetical protein